LNVSIINLDFLRSAVISSINNNVFSQNTVGDNFTYSFWLYVNGNNNCINKDNNWNSYRNKEWKSIFYRGTPINEDGNLTNLVQFPGFWLTPVLNNLVIVFQNANNIERLYPYTLNQITFEIDRFSVNKSITYDYDTTVTPNIWTALPSATPAPVPLDSEDFYALFPRKTIIPDEPQY
jgi:hypothetical protein